MKVRSIFHNYVNKSIKICKMMIEMIHHFLKHNFRHLPHITVLSVMMRFNILDIVAGSILKLALVVNGTTTARTLTT